MNKYIRMKIEANRHMAWIKYCTLRRNLTGKITQSMNLEQAIFLNIICIKKNHVHMGVFFFKSTFYMYKKNNNKCTMNRCLKRLCRKV